MDRVITYVGQSVYEWLFSKQGQSSMVGLAKLSAAMFGSNTVVNGLSCVPTGPASLQVVINPGEIYSFANLENSVCGTLPTDSHSVMKQGVLLDAFTTAAGALPAPGTAGQSVNYLIEAQYSDSDVSVDPTTGNTPVVLQFYNASNPGSPWSGPGGLGGTSNTFRKGVVSLQIKAGAAATTGSQTTPSPDAGWVGLWVVTVANGQTQINAGNISQYAGAPILPSSLLASIQNGNLSYAVATGTANAHTIALTPALTSRVDGMMLRYKAPAANMAGGVTLNDGIGTATVLGANHAALQGGEYIANGDAIVIWNSSISGGSYILVECTGGALQISPATQSRHAMQFGQANGRLLNIVTITSSGTYTPSSSLVTAIMVEVIGGGGAGGGAPVTNSSQIGLGAGGNAGAFSRTLTNLAGLTLPATVTIGAGGVGGTGTGPTGGNTIFNAGSVVLTANGGIGGQSAGLVAPPLVVGNGTPSTASGGFLNVPGGVAIVGSVQALTSGYSGQGASAFYGSGGGVQNGSGNGFNAAGFGSGGSGALALASNGTARNGGNGTPGVALVYEYS